MTTNVRLFFHGPMIALPVSSPSSKFAHGDVIVPRYPYLARQIMEAGLEARMSDPSPAGSEVLIVDADGLTAFELVPENASPRNADQFSPRLPIGRSVHSIGKGWRVSILDVT